jgi:hypothetical protein
MRPETTPVVASRNPWAVRWGVGLARLGATALIVVLVLFSFTLLGLVNVLQAWSKKYGA